MDPGIPQLRLNHYHSYFADLLIAIGVGRWGSRRKHTRAKKEPAAQQALLAKRLSEENE